MAGRFGVLLFWLPRIMNNGILLVICVQITGCIMSKNKKKRNQPQKVCNYTAFISTNQILLRNLHSKIRNPIFSFYPTQK